MARERADADTALRASDESDIEMMKKKVTPALVTAMKEDDCS